MFVEEKDKSNKSKSDMEEREKHSRKVIKANDCIVPYIQKRVSCKQDKLKLLSNHCKLMMLYDIKLCK